MRKFRKKKIQFRLKIVYFPIEMNYFRNEIERSRSQSTKIFKMRTGGCPKIKQKLSEEDLSLIFRI